METATQPPSSAKPPAHMLNQVGNFIRQYLVCSGQQAVLLTDSGIHLYSPFDSLPARTLGPLVGSIHVFGVFSAFFLRNRQ